MVEDRHVKVSGHVDIRQFRDLQLMHRSHLRSYPGPVPSRSYTGDKSIANTQFSASVCLTHDP